MSDSLDSAPALIFIPDMNGFTGYISKTDIKITKKVIPALLETIISANDLNMTMAEIQGDAVLFYRIGEPPAPNELVAQSKQTFLAFSEKLEALSRELPDMAGSLPESLGIKIVAHYGKIGLTKIRGFVKLIGQDVIIAHRLLKNSTKTDEYLLISEQYASRFNKEELDRVFAFGELKYGQDEYPHIGVIPYRYASLKPLFSGPA
jgi:hypothetical protein